MDWIERLFHVAPDGGNGSLEVAIIAGAAVALALVVASAIGLRAAVKHWFARVASQPAQKGPAPSNRLDG